MSLACDSILVPGNLIPLNKLNPSSCIRISASTCYGSGDDGCNCHSPFTEYEKKLRNPVTVCVMYIFLRPRSECSSKGKGETRDRKRKIAFFGNNFPSIDCRSSKNSTFRSIQIDMIGKVGRGREWWLAAAATTSLRRGTSVD